MALSMPVGPTLIVDMSKNNKPLQDTVTLIKFPRISSLTPPPTSPLSYCVDQSAA